MPRKQTIFVYLGFGLFGLCQGVWSVLLADVRSASGATTGEFGLAMSLGIIAAFPLIRLAGYFVDKYGIARVLAPGWCCLALSFYLLSFVDDKQFLILGCLAFFGCNGIVDVGVNASGIRYENQLQRPVLLYLHSTYSAVCLVGVAFAGSLLSFGLTYRIILGIVAAIIFLGFVPALNLRFRSAVDQSISIAEMSLPLVYSHRRIVAFLGPIMAVAFFAEGAMATWSTYYLRAPLNYSAALGALGGAAFFGAMTIGRIFGGAVIQRAGRKRIILMSGLLVMFGVFISISTTYLPIVIFGFLLIGAALSTIVPVIFAVAGDLAPNNNGQITSALTITGYLGFVIGPSAIGILADASSLRASLTLIGVVGFLVMVLAYLASRKNILIERQPQMPPSEVIPAAPDATQV